MAANIEALRDYYRELAKDNPKMQDIADMLGITAKVSRSSGGPEEIPDAFPVTLAVGKQASERKSETTTLNWKMGLIKFCEDHADLIARLPRNWEQIGREFNEYFAGKLTVDTRISDLTLPKNDDDWSADRKWRERSSKIHRTFKGIYNHILYNLIYRITNDVTVGDVRLMSDARLDSLDRISPANVRFLRIALAEPVHQEAYTQ